MKFENRSTTVFMELLSDLIILSSFHNRLSIPVILKYLGFEKHLLKIQFLKRPGFSVRITNHRAEIYQGILMRKISNLPNIYVRKNISAYST